MGRFEIQPIFRPRLKFSHKGTHGHGAIIGGSHGKIGAIQLAGRACLRAGAGLVTCVVPNCGYLPLQTAVPEAMVITDTHETQTTHIVLPINVNAVGIGVGMGTSEATAIAFEAFLKVHDKPMVIDADALNIISESPSLLGFLPSKSILTPHEGELKRLVGGWTDDFDKLEKVKKFSEANDCIIVVKGAHSIVVNGQKGYINASGNPGMATAGSGDVLSGIITAFLAQGYGPLQAAIFGVYLHGLSGDIAVSESSPEALLASDIIKNLGKAFSALFAVESQT